MMARWTNPPRAVGYVVAAILAALAIGAASAWAAVTAFRPAEDPLATPTYTFVEVVKGEVGADITVTTVAEWKPLPVGENKASGVVTSVAVSAGDEVDQGAQLYSVNLRPVVAARGEIPAFRSIALDTQGPDVAQLQQMLADLGLYRNAVDGKVGAGTVAAIKAWQKSLGVEQTGEIGVGDVIFVPTLPTRVALDITKIARGTSLSGGEALVSGLPAAPLFTIPVTESQAGMMPTGTRVEITSPSGALWEGLVTDHARDAESQTVIVNLVANGDTAICGVQCAEVPVTGQARLTSRVVTVESVEGLVVPSAALVSSADGSVALIDEAGERLPVTVSASARGMSIIDGVPAGTKVRIPGEVGTE